MQRFFAKIVGEGALFSSTEEHHLLNVMRAQEGELFEVADEGVVYLARLVSRNPLRVHLQSRLPENNELPSNLFLGFSLLKGGHDELVLLKGTELGVKGFFPFVSERTIIRLDEKEKAKRLERFVKIVEEGAKQSKRTSVPTVFPIVSFPKLLQEPADVKVIAYENEKEKIGSLDEAFFALPRGGKLLALVGPEGGFSQAEVESAHASGFRSVGLGKRILRAETASLYLASAFSYAKEGR
jgi:RNA methyltransferase, RsmE family